MSTSLDMLSLLAPELDSVAEATRTAMLAHFAGTQDSSAWGDSYTEAVVLLTAHQLTLNNRAANGTSGAGPVQMERASKQTVQYGSVSTGSMSDAPYLTTRHGVAFVALRGRIGVGSFAAVVT